MASDTETESVTSQIYDDDYFVLKRNYGVPSHKSFIPIQVLGTPEQVRHAVLTVMEKYFVLTDEMKQMPFDKLFELTKFDPQDKRYFYQIHDNIIQ
jgi:hypothetical protein